MPMKKIRWFAVAVWMLVIFAFSHQAYSGRETEKYLGEVNVPVRKAGHIGEYMILFLLVRWALKTDNAGKENKTEVSGTTSSDSTKPTTSGPIKVLASPATIAFIVSIVYAGTDEWHQSYVPGRSATVNDVAVDTVGLVLGALVLLAVRRLGSWKRL